ncbi:serine/threonine-protein kinase [Egibacter rhizosphaerae]|uniref:non-specific serine/threonine protein kinase n=1 Tax=Egibacter rhizosphaerae TaxID=1670831 RepID=A0A411YAB9_9ACTN|nr:Stk1 family PASTA domain-containing Ser/Thr kinase [Egibacter rhizosphaerae]QBI18163.1 serine/threonine-protein kinase [Egibacter rhizosphaerae]
MRSADDPSPAPPDSELRSSPLLFDRQHEWHEQEWEAHSEAGVWPDPHRDAVVRPGELLDGRYRVGARIGAGGMGTIHRGRDERLQRAVAIKVLHAHLADDSDLLARFAREGRRAAALSHPHIVAVHDEGVAGLPYIVMELVDGPSLRDVLRERGRLSPAEAMAALAPVARALGRAHEAGVVHRDVKPENVLIDPEGTPKIADFGIARLLAGTNHTQTGALIGSVHYMAPELVDGARANSATDQYALGIVLFELLTGARPFSGDTPMAVALRHVREPVPPPSESVPEIPTEVDEVVGRATAQDAADRFTDVDAFADALGAAVPDGPQPVVLTAPDDPDGVTLVIGAATTPPAGLVHTPPDPGVEGAPHGPPAPGGFGPPAPDPGMPSHHGTEGPDGIDGDGAHGIDGDGPDGGDAVDGRGAGVEADAESSAATARPRRRGRRVLVVGLLALGLLVGAAGGGLAWWHWVHAPLTAVPSVVGIEQEAALAELRDTGFNHVIADEQHHPDVAEGHVIEQAPSPEQELRPGEDVAITVSLGRRFADVPDVTGLPESEALDEIEAAELEPVREERHDDEVPSGHVIEQTPAPTATSEEQLRQGDEVEVVVSLGIEQVEVPDVVGEDEGAATAALDDADLTLGEIATTWSDEHPTAGTVIGQSMDPGATVDRDSTVDLTVSLGPETIEMPNVRGDGVESAEAELEDRHLEVVVEGIPRPTFGPFTRGEIGLVEEQLPTPGDAVVRGETVTLYTYQE